MNILTFCGDIFYVYGNLLLEKYHRLIDEDIHYRVEASLLEHQI